LEALPVREQQMASLTRDYEMSKLNYKSLLDKQMSAEMATDMERRQHAERFTLLDPAIVSQVPFKPNRPLLGGLAVALALALGLGAGLGNELRKQCILGEWELPAGTPVIGRLPVIICDAAPQEPFLRRCLRPKLLAAALFGTVFLAAGAYIAWVGI
jgi:hypothetical protein